MESTLRKVGNSMGLIIPKSMLPVLGGEKVELTTSGNTIIITGKKKVREGWAEAITDGGDELLMDFSNDFDSEEWEW